MSFASRRSASTGEESAETRQASRFVQCRCRARTRTNQAWEAKRFTAGWVRKAGGDADRMGERSVSQAGHMASRLSSASRILAKSAPTTVWTLTPLLKKRNVGIAVISWPHSTFSALTL